MGNELTEAACLSELVRFIEAPALCTAAVGAGT